MRFNLPTVSLYFGLCLMTVCGAWISNHIGATWQVAGFGLGIMFVAFAPISQLNSRMKKLEERARSLKMGD